MWDVFRIKVIFGPYSLDILYLRCFLFTFLIYKPLFIGQIVLWTLNATSLKYNNSIIGLRRENSILNYLLIIPWSQLQIVTFNNLGKLVILGVRPLSLASVLFLIWLKLLIIILNYLWFLSALQIVLPLVDLLLNYVFFLSLAFLEFRICIWLYLEFCHLVFDFFFVLEESFYVLYWVFDLDWWSVYILINTQVFGILQWFRYQFILLRLISVFLTYDINLLPSDIHPIHFLFSHNLFIRICLLASFTAFLRCVIINHMYSHLRILSTLFL